MGRGMQKNDQRQNGKRKSQQNDPGNPKTQPKNSHHIPKLLTLQGLPHMSAHPRHMWVHSDNLINYGRILQHRRHLLEELGRVHHRLHLKCASGQYVYKKRSRAEKHDFRRTIFGSFGFNPMSPNGFNPAIAPNPMWLFNCVSGSCGFCPVCIVGKGCGVELEEGEAGLEAPPAERAMPLTM